MRVARVPEARVDELDRVVDNLRRLVYVLYAHARRVERLADLTPAQAWLITALSGSEPTKVSDLAGSMHLSPSAVVRIVVRLEERGLVVRTRSSNDRGTVKVALTHVGMKTAASLPPAPQELLLNGLSEIPPDRLRTVSDGVASLTRILGASDMNPRLFFGSVANVRAGGRIDGHRTARTIPRSRARGEDK